MDKYSLIPHLIEIRSRLIRSVLAILVIFLCLVPWAGEIYDILARPMLSSLPNGSLMIATGVVTPFLIPVKVTLMLSFLLALPYVLYHVWAFVVPGLYQHERRLLIPLMIASTLLFVFGMFFCYLFVFQTVFKFVSNFAPESIAIAPDIQEYLGFVMTMFIAFGVSFEAPILVVILVWFNIATIDTLKKSRGYVIVGAFILGAIMAPPDVLSQFLLAIPVCLLFEIGLLCARWIPRSPRQQKEAESN